MNRMKQMIYLALVVLVASMSISAQPQIRQGRGNNRAVRLLLDRVNESTDRFRATLDATLDKSRYDGTRREDDINAFVRD